MARTGQLTESRIQSAVWQIELGHGKVVVYWILVVLLGLALGLVYTAVEFRGLEKREAIDQAQLARNIAQGQGYTTSVIRPLSMWHLMAQAGWSQTDKRLLTEHPDLVNAPLYPWLLSWLFQSVPDETFQPKVEDRVFVPERWVILPFNQVLLLLTLVVIYRWARELFDHRVAIATGLLLLFSDQLWRFGVSGLNTNLAMLLVLLAFYCLYRVDRRLSVTAAEETGPAPVIGWVVASAALLGLCFLTRYKLGVLILPGAWYLWRATRGRRPWVHLLVYAAVFVAVITPWLVRNYRVSHSLVGIAKYQLIETGGPFSGDSLGRAYDPTRQDRLKEAYAARPIIAKFITGVRTHLYDTTKQIGFAFLVFFFGAGLMYGFRRPEVARLRNATLGILATAILAMSLIGTSPELGPYGIYGDNLLVLLLPIVAMYGVAFFYLLLDRIPFRIRLTRGLAIGVFALVNVGPFLFTLLPPRRGPQPILPYMPSIYRVVASFFTPNEVGVSDLPWAMAWQGNRRTVWLPEQVADFYNIHDFVADSAAPVSFVFLTPYMLDRPLMSDLTHGEYQGWAGMVLASKLPPMFPLTAATPLPPQNNPHLLYADRPRWKDQPQLTPAPPKAGTDTAPSTPEQPAAPAPEAPAPEAPAAPATPAE